VDVLSAGLSMGRFSLHTFEKGRPGSGIAHFFGAMRLDLFGDAAAIRRHIASILDEVRRSHKAVGHDRIYIHGEKESEARVRSLQTGIELDDETRRLLAGYIERFRLPPLE